MTESTKTTEIEVEDHELLLRLTGPDSAHLRALESELGVQMGLRGSVLRLQGDPEQVRQVARVLGELLEILRERKLGGNELVRAARVAVGHPEVSLRKLFDNVVLRTTSKRTIAPKGPAQSLYVDAIRNHDVVFGIGPAGTGKTYLAMAMAVAALQDKKVRRIILTRPAVEAGEKLGFLPGDLVEKVNPYLRPLYDALGDMLHADRVAAMIDRGIIEVAPLAFMRGRTLNDAFVILDEAQNTTVEQMKMFLTRLGFGSRAVITGDSTQVDLPRGQSSGLRDAEHLLEGIEGIAFCRFTDVDVVRHSLVQKIIQAYDARDAHRLAARFEREERDRERRERASSPEPKRED